MKRLSHNLSHQRATFAKINKRDQRQQELTPDIMREPGPRLLATLSHLRKLENIQASGVHPWRCQWGTRTGKGVKICFLNILQVWESLVQREVKIRFCELTFPQPPAPQTYSGPQTYSRHSAESHTHIFLALVKREGLSSHKDHDLGLVQSMLFNATSRKVIYCLLIFRSFLQVQFKGSLQKYFHFCFYLSVMPAFALSYAKKLSKQYVITEQTYGQCYHK